MRLSKEEKAAIEEQRMERAKAAHFEIEDARRDYARRERLGIPHPASEGFKAPPMSWVGHLVQGLVICAIIYGIGWYFFGWPIPRISFG